MFTYSKTTHPAFITHWEQYNRTAVDPNKKATVVLPVQDEKGKVSFVKEYFESYTHYFFNAFNFETYLNLESKNVLQLGPSTGEFLQQCQLVGPLTNEFLQPYREANINDVTSENFLKIAKYDPLNWRVMGYDYSEISINYLSKNNIPTRRIDLNEVNEDGTLNYAHELAEDLAEPCNIFAIRILEYLNTKAALLLIASLIDLAKPGSVFFFVMQVEPAERKTKILSLKANLCASFFAPRTDMEFLVNERTNVGKDREIEDEVLVLRKH